MAVAGAQGEPEGQSPAAFRLDQGVEHTADDPAAAVAIPAIEGSGVRIAPGMVTALGSGAVTGLVAVAVAAALQVGAIAGEGEGCGVRDQAMGD